MRNLTRALLLCIMVAAWAAPARADPAPLTLGVHPFKPAAQLIEAFTPLANDLAARIGRPVAVRISKDYEEHIERVGKDEFDIAYLGPAPYVQMRKRYGAKQLLARQRIGDNPTFHGKIFVRADSTINSLTDLRHKRIALGDPHSTMSNMVPRAMLLQAGLPADQLTRVGMVKDQVNIVLGVLSGDYDAGAVKEDVFFEHEKRGLRAIATSPPVSDHLFVASNRLDTKTVETVRALLLEMAARSEGVKIMQAITAGMTGFVPVGDQDYDSLRKLLATLEDQQRPR